MMKSIPKILAVSLWLFSLQATDLHAASAGVVANISGTLSAIKPDGSVKILSMKSEIEPGDVLTTEKDSYARIKFSDGGEVTIRPNSRIKLDEYGFNENVPEKDSMVFSLIKGGLRTITGLVGKRGRQDAYRLNTANATIGIRGTHYGAHWCFADCGSLQDGLYVDVASGVINARNNGGDLDIGAGQFGFVGSINLRPVLLPTDAPVPDTNSNQTTGSGGEGSQVGGGGCFVH